MITTRDDLPNLIKPDSVGVELGVLEGGYSQILLDSGKFKELNLVDIFEGSVTSSTDKHGNNLTLFNLPVLHKSVIKRFENNSEVLIHKTRSVDFLKSFDGKLDFVYIDSAHDYSTTVQELELSYKLMSPGGILSGHDYASDYWPGVSKAVNEFAEKYSLKLYVTTEDGIPSFMFQIPE